MCHLKVKHLGRLRLAAAAAVLIVAGCAPRLPYPKQTPTVQFSAAPLNDTASLTLAWDAAPDPSVVGYNVYHGTAPRNYTSTTNVGANMTCRLDGFNIGETYHFAATSYNAAGVESVYSEELVYTVASKELVVVLFYGETPTGPWTPMSTNTVAPTAPAKFFIQEIRWNR